MEDEALSTVVDFLNTLDVEDQTDVLTDLDRWRGWVGSRLGLDGDLETRRSRDEARALRDQLRDLASGSTPEAAYTVPVMVAVGPADEIRLAADTPVGRVAAAVARLSIERRWSRVKICPADDCRVAFYDESRNHSRQWCSMKVCGNRAKARTHRERSTG